jgi:hypothetical protein
VKVLSKLICKLRGHDFAGGSIAPPYEPPYCTRCGFILAERVGISYADFMRKAEAAFDSGTKIEAARITSGSIPASKITT